MYSNPLKCGNSVWSITFCFILAAVAMMIPDFAAAATLGDATGSGAVANVVCNVVADLQGPVARGVAAFGIIFLGFSLFLGKITWGTAIALAIGLGAIFGAEAIVGVLSGGTDACVTVADGGSS